MLPAFRQRNTNVICFRISCWAAAISAVRDLASDSLLGGVSYWLWSSVSTAPPSRICSSSLLSLMFRNGPTCWLMREMSVGSSSLGISGDGQALRESARSSPSSSIVRYRYSRWANIVTGRYYARRPIKDTRFNFAPGGRNFFASEFRMSRSMLFLDLDGDDDYLSLETLSL